MKLKEVNSSKYSKALVPPQQQAASLQLLCSQKGGRPIARDTALDHLSTAPKWEPECRKRYFFFPGGGLLLPKTSARGGFLQGREVGRRQGGGPVRAAVSQGGTHSSSGSCPLPGAEIWRQKITGENSGSTKGNFSGSPEIFPQLGEKSLK